MFYEYSFMQPSGEISGYFVTFTYPYNYMDWERELNGASDRDWRNVCGHLDDDGQYSLLRGMAVLGVSVQDWNAIFRDLYNGSAPFQNTINGSSVGRPSLTWTYFATQLAQRGPKLVHYPPVYPAWLVPYGYSQQQYLQDLSSFWRNIHDHYYHPWPGTILHEDSPEIARIKKIGEEARREIDQVARHSSQYLKH